MVTVGKGDIKYVNCYELTALLLLIVQWKLRSALRIEVRLVFGMW